MKFESDLLDSSKFGKSVSQSFPFSVKFHCLLGSENAYLKILKQSLT